MPRRPRRLPYSEGDQIAVPVSDGWARGVIARYDGRGIVLGYFFAPRLKGSVPPAVAIRLAASDAIVVAMFGDLGLLGGKWRVVGPTPDYRRDEWPVPTFGHADAIRDDVGWLVAYDDKGREASRRPVPIREVAGLPEDGLYGDRALSARLDAALRDSVRRLH